MADDLDVVVLGGGFEAVEPDYERVATRRDGIVNQLWKGIQGLMRNNQIEVVQGSGYVRDRGHKRGGRPPDQGQEPDRRDGVLAHRDHRWRRRRRRVRDLHSA